MFAITLPVTYVMVRLVEHGIQKLTVDPTFPKRWGVYFGIKYQKWKKMEAVVATSWVHALKINSQMGFTKQSNPTSRIKILSFTTQLCILSIQSSTLLHLTSRLHETKIIFIYQFSTLLHLTKILTNRLHELKHYLSSLVQ